PRRAYPAQPGTPHRPSSARALAGRGPPARRGWRAPSRARRSCAPPGTELAAPAPAGSRTMGSPWPRRCRTRRGANMVMEDNGRRAAPAGAESLVRVQPVLADLVQPGARADVARLGGRPRRAEVALLGGARLVAAGPLQRHPDQPLLEQRAVPLDGQPIGGQLV